jgi:hypothetical protein
MVFFVVVVSLLFAFLVFGVIACQKQGANTSGATQASRHYRKYTWRMGELQGKFGVRVSVNSL